MRTVDVVVGASDRDEATRDELALALSGLLTARGDISAVTRGVSEDERWGTECSVWLAATVREDELALLRAGLASVARVFEQDGIALTVGTFELVSGRRGRAIHRARPDHSSVAR